MPVARPYGKGNRTPWRALLAITLLWTGQAGADTAGSLEFSLYRNAGKAAGITVLVVGGIQGDIARRVAGHVNEELTDLEHAYRVKNTRTREGDREMAKTLTYYAINNLKPAVGFGRIVEAENSFVVELREGYRVNVIGWRRKGVDNESGVEIEREAISRRFSVDSDGTTFRVEVYKDDKFTGMVLVRFVEQANASRQQALRPLS